MSGLEIAVDYYSTLLEKEEKDYISIGHLRWMLEQIKKPNVMSDTKKHRWLGYIQGVMVSMYGLDVSQERNRTRPWFNGE